LIQWTQIPIEISCVIPLHPLIQGGSQ